MTFFLLLRVIISESTMLNVRTLNARQIRLAYKVMETIYKRMRTNFIFWIRKAKHKLKKEKKEKKTKKEKKSKKAEKKKEKAELKLSDEESNNSER